MTARRVLLHSLTAVLLPVVVVTAYLGITMAMTIVGYGPGAAFVEDIGSDSSNVVRSAAAYVNLNRLVTLPLIIVVIAVATARTAVSAVGVVTAAVTAAVIGGYPSAIVVLLLSVVYVVLGGVVRSFARRRVVARA